MKLRRFILYVGKLPNVTEHLKLIKRGCLTRAKVQKQTRMALPAVYQQGHTQGHKHNIVAPRINDAITACPAFGIECRQCHKLGHFSKKCVEPHTQGSEVNTFDEFQVVPNNEYEEMFVGSLVKTENKTKITL